MFKTSKGKYKSPTGLQTKGCPLRLMELNSASKPSPTRLTGAQVARENNLIYLSKPLGVGYLLAAYFNNSDLLDSKDFNEVLTSMKLSNKNASEVAKKHQTKRYHDPKSSGCSCRRKPQLSRIFGKRGFGPIFQNSSICQSRRKHYRLYFAQRSRLSRG